MYRPEDKSGNQIGPLTQETVEELRKSLNVKPEIVNKENPKMGGGLRHNTGKAELDQVPSSLNFAVAKTLEYGMGKYAKNNWRQGMSWVTVYSCLQRHLQKWNDGDLVDDESLLPHLYHAACNIAFLIEYAETYPEGDDRFKGKINRAADSFDKVKFKPYVKPDKKE